MDPAAASVYVRENLARHAMNLRLFSLSSLLAFVLGWGLASAPAAVHAQQGPDAFDEYDAIAAPKREPSPPAKPRAAEAKGRDSARRRSRVSREEKRGQERRSETKPSDESEREASLRLHNTLLGPIGGVHVVDAGSAAPGTFRVQLAAEFFYAKDFIFQGDDHDHIGGVFSASWTVTRYLELFSSVSAYANSNDREEPRLLQSIGDLYAGAKAFHAVLPWLTLGGDFSMALLNSVGDIGVVFKSTSFGFRGNATADFRKLPARLPLLARFNAQYWFDNSSKLIESVERARYAAIETPAPLPDEDRHLVSPAERFGLGINRTDFFRLALGLEAPIPLRRNVVLQPLLEWTWKVPVNRQGYSCLVLGDGSEGCLDREGVSAFPQTMTLGLRVLPPLRGLGLLAALDVGLRGTSGFVRELAPNAPYMVRLAVGYAYDPAPRFRPAPPPPPPPAPKAEGVRVEGYIIDRSTALGVSDVVIRFRDRDLNPLASKPDGSFLSPPLEAGNLSLELFHPKYELGSCSIEVPASSAKPQALRCFLQPKAVYAALRGQVVSTRGKAIAGASLKLEGTKAAEGTSDDEGRFTFEGLEAGEYRIQAEAEGYLIGAQTLRLVAEQTQEIRVELAPKPKRASVELKSDRLALRKKIKFASNSATIRGESAGLMQEIADALLRHPEIGRVEIQGHTDDRGGAARNLQLSQERADAVKARLVELGVSGERLDARGYGDTRPLAPNITASNRAKNRRVQFSIASAASR